MKPKHRYEKKSQVRKITGTKPNHRYETQTQVRWEKKGWYEKKSQVRKKITGMLDPNTGMLDPITGMKKNHRYEKKRMV